MTTSSALTIKPVNIIAHRGISPYKVPENLIQAIEPALKLGFQVETDVQRVKGGYVLYHDDFIPGPDDKELNGGGFYLPSGKKPTTECTLDEVLLKAQFNRGKLEGLLSKQAGETVHLELNESPKIATLEELFALMKRFPNSKVFLEIKRPSETDVYNDGVEEEIVGMISDAGLLDNIVVISFNESSLRNTRKANSNISIGADVYYLTAKDPSIDPRDAKRMKEEIGISYWNPPFNEITRSLIRASEKLGLEVAPWVWKENKREELAEIIRLVKGLKLKNVMVNQAVLAEETLRKSDDSFEVKN